jgi:hypothetical protein
LISIPELLIALSSEKLSRLKVEVEINICKLAPHQVSYNASRQSVACLLKLPGLTYLID